MATNRGPAVVVLYLLLTGSGSLAATSASRFSVDRPVSGLPSSAVLAVTQTRDGYLWIGTFKGLARFDGVRLEEFRDPAAPSLTGGTIVHLFEDNHRNLWVGAESAGVVLIDAKGRIPPLENIGRPGREGRLAAVVEDKQGAVWLLPADGTLCRYLDGKADVWSGFPSQSDCRALVCDESGLLWVGYVSDRGLSRWGRRHPFLYASAIPISFMYFFLWNPPAGLTHLQLFFYLLLLSMVIRAAITCYETPSASLGPELSGDYVERSALLSYRYFFGWFGGLTTYNLVWFWFAPSHVDAQYPDGRLNPDTWTVYGLVASILMFIAILTTAIGTHRHIPYLIQPPPSRKFDARKLFGELKETLLSNRSYLYLFVSGMVAAVAAGIETAFSIYFDSYFWELTTREMLIRGCCIYVSPIIGLAIVPYFTDRLGKKATVIGVWAFQTVFTVAPFMLRLIGWFPENHSPWLLPVLCAHVIINVSLIILVGATLSSMVFDLVEDIQRDTGRREEGLLFSARSFADKAVTGLGITIAGAILSIIQFPERAVPGAIPDATLAKLALFYTPLALGFYLIAVLLVRGYTLTREDHEKNLSVVAAAPAET